MERKARRLSRKSYYASRVRKVARLLFYRRHSTPGAKGWELRRRVGSDYPKIIKLLDEYLSKIGLTVKVVFEEANPPENPSLEQYNKARFYVTLKDNLTTDEAKLVGWRIDDLAALCASIAYIISKGGKAPRKELEKLLESKIPDWRVDMNLNRFVRLGYLIEDDNEQIYLGWRTRAEVDQKRLIDMLLEAEMST